MQGILSAKGSSAERSMQPSSVDCLCLPYQMGASCAYSRRRSHSRELTVSSTSLPMAGDAPFQTQFCSDWICGRIGLALCSQTFHLLRSTGLFEMTELDAFVEINNPTITSFARRHVVFDAGHVRTAVICDRASDKSDGRPRYALPDAERCFGKKLKRGHGQIFWRGAGADPARRIVMRAMTRAKPSAVVTCQT